MTDASPAPGRRRISPLGWLAIGLGGLLAAILIAGSLNESADHAPAESPAEAPALWGVGILPFVGVLAAIAFLPLLPQTRHWWESNLNRLAVSMFFSALTLIYISLAEGVEWISPLLQHALIDEYIPFIVLLFSLYVISGGIRLTGDLQARPATNTALLAIGTLSASVIGTTGASMLFIRPLLQTNRERRHTLHTVIFFIFLVSNIGGTLLPIGDPPLFLGYLRGVHFLWTLNLWQPWLVCSGTLLVMYFIWDSIAYRREGPAAIERDVREREPLRVQGLINLPWLAGVVLAVALVNPDKVIPGTEWHPFPFLRECLMLLLVLLSLATTPRGIRESNRFNYHAILEVAALFIGIFIAMQIPIEVLHARGAAITEQFHEPWQFFWMTGALSSFLDNAPTYVVFFELAQTMPADQGENLYVLRTGGTIPVSLLAAVSIGAVFMGAMTYIGNGPNFMVKSIAEQAGVRMPTFLGYLFRYSIPILIPTFLVMMCLFFFSWSPLSLG